jgi:hypothetical protein
LLAAIDVVEAVTGFEDVKKLKLVHYKITQCPEEFMRLPRTFVSS